MKKKEKKQAKNSVIDKKVTNKTPVNKSKKVTSEKKISSNLKKGKAELKPLAKTIAKKKEVLPNKKLEPAISNKKLELDKKLKATKKIVLLSGSKKPISKIAQVTKSKPLKFGKAKISHTKSSEKKSVPIKKIATNATKNKIITTKASAVKSKIVPKTKKPVISKSIKKAKDKKTVQQISKSLSKKVVKPRTKASAKVASKVAKKVPAPQKHKITSAPKSINTKEISKNKPLITSKPNKNTEVKKISKESVKVFKPVIKAPIIEEKNLVSKKKAKKEKIPPVLKNKKTTKEPDFQEPIIENIVFDEPPKKMVLQKLEIKKNVPVKESKKNKLKVSTPPPRELWRPDYSVNSPSIDKYTFVNANKPEPIKITSGNSTGKVVKFEIKKADVKKTEIKTELLNKCLEILSKSVSIAKKEMDDAQESANEEKGSTEEKFDSFRESMQAARDMFARQYSEGVNSVSLVNRINPKMEHNAVILGSIVKTDLMNYFVSASLGEITIGKEKFIAISIQTPLCQAIFGKKKGDTFKLMNKTYTIKEVF